MNPDDSLRHSVQTDGPHGRLVGEVEGTGGIPVVFIHGMGGDRRLWTAQIDFVGAHRSALAIDLRGHGESSNLGLSGFSMETYASDVFEIMHACQIERAVLVGHSMGAFVAIACLQKAPERVAGVVLADPPPVYIRVFEPGKPIEPARMDDVDAYFRSILVPASAVTRRGVLEALHHTTATGLQGDRTALVTYDPVPAWRSYQGPRLVIQSTRGPLAGGLSTFVPGVPTETMPNVSHWLMMDDPPAFNLLLERFVRTVEQSKGG